LIKAASKPRHCACSRRHHDAKRRSEEIAVSLADQRIRSRHQRAIALAIPGGGPVLGSLNLIFFSSSMTPEAAALKYLPSMKVAVKEIERRWSTANKARGKVA